jgi:hypothetical protein
VNPGAFVRYPFDVIGQEFGSDLGLEIVPGCEMDIRKGMLRSQDDGGGATRSRGMEAANRPIEVDKRLKNPVDTPLFFRRRSSRF